jgi:uncharacterized protein (DUF1800 family)
MQNWIKQFAKLLIFSGCFLLFSFFEIPTTKPHFTFPYKKAGLTEREAAAHLLSRFTFGATPGQIDEVVKIGLEKWFEQQLDGSLPDDELNQRLAAYDALKLSNTEIVNTYPRPPQILRMAVQDGVINKDSLNKSDKKEYRQQLAAYMQQKGLKPQQELFRQFINQKILRAAYSNNQLQEVMTDFWFNHFNVSITKNDCAEFIPVYERDAIRPHVVGKFDTLLLATAKSPAMLLYLDNFSSSGENTNSNLPGNQQVRKLIAQKQEHMVGDSLQKGIIAKLKNAKKGQGLNENYAREVMELHTLGVDGGYTQQDVTQAARVLTGWTIYPLGDKGYGSAIKGLINRIGEEKLIKQGFVHDGDFLFAINRHDNKEKKVLGKTFAANGGYEEGVQLLNMLAHHPSTAKFISKKLAVRFVSDNPPQSLIDKMATTFLEKDGDIKEVLITMVSSPEFWSKDVIRAKTKSPFELVISAARALNVDVKAPYQLFTWSDKMGQKMYFYQAPTGFPDKGQYWINTGALLNRMNFGLAIASQRIVGTNLDLLALNNHHEPESATAALVTYGKITMPERNLNETVKRLTPMLNDPDLVQKINTAADKNQPVKQPDMASSDMMNDNSKMDNANGDNPKAKGLKKLKNNNGAIQTSAGNNSMLSQVVGIIIGSPEFQRR